MLIIKPQLRQFINKYCKINENKKYLLLLSPGSPENEKFYNFK